MTFAKMDFARGEEEILAIRRDDRIEDFPIAVRPLRHHSRGCHRIHMSKARLFRNKVSRGRIRQPSKSLQTGTAYPGVIVKMIEHLDLGRYGIDQHQPSILAIVGESI